MKNILSILATVLVVCACNNNESSNSSYSSDADALNPNKSKSSSVKDTKDEDEAEQPEYMTEGKKVYSTYCLTCHQSNGAGVANLNPPLTKTEFVVGDKETMLSIILSGSNQGLEVNGETYSNAMPAHNFLSDKQIADVASYVRNSFGNEAEPVTEEEVKEVRSKMK